MINGYKNKSSYYVLLIKRQEEIPWSLSRHAGGGIILCICLLWSFAGFGQNGKISGTISDRGGDALPGVYIHLAETDQLTVTDENGRYEIEQLAPGNYTLITSMIGYRPLRHKLILQAGQSLKISLTLEESTTALDEVTVTGRSEATLLRESPASVATLETEAFYSRSVNTSDLLNTISGVQVRQSGGMGNQAEVSIQGLSGRQVKLFVDGIPMDFLLPVEELGLGSALAMLPVNLMERMEVYKGAVPVSLGADALGGAINIVTRKDFHDYLDITAEHASFNTWRSTLSAKKRYSSGIDLSLAAFYSSSDNTYLLEDIKIVNEFGNPESIAAPKFHDRFRSYLLKGEVGISNKSWADRLAFSHSFGDLYDEIQHNFEMRQPYGQALNLATVHNSALRYEKSGLANKLDLQLYLGYNRIITSFIDTTHNIYNWRGEIIGSKTYGGEITTSQNNLTLTGENLIGRINLNYAISATTRLVFNSVTSIFTRSGTDPVAAAYYGEDYFREPVRINRMVSGIGFEKTFWDGKLTSHTAVKAYQYFSEGFLIEDGVSSTTRQHRFQPGGSQSFSWKINKRLIAKASYEYATRMPDRVETLGDFSQAINANPGIKPERSHNLNLGLWYKRQMWSLETNAFFRQASDIIILQAVPPPVLSKYENLLKAGIAGLEGELQLRPRPWLLLRANATYQDLRNRSKKENAGVSSDRYFGARLPNRPHLFGHAEILVKKNKLLHADDQLQAWWSTSFTEAFFRYWEIDGRKEDKLTIPRQWQHHVGLSYTDQTERMTLSLGAQNIFDTPAYDNFRVQKPGRSWQVKLRVFITQI